MSVTKYLIATLENLSVSAAHIANGAVETLKIAAGAVTSEKIADEAVTSEKIADEAVDFTKISEDLDLVTRLLPVRAPCRVATVSNIASLAGGAPLSHDGVSLTLSDRVLVRSQSTPSQNGIYQVSIPGSGSNGTWIRAADADTAGDLFESIETYVTEGAVNSGKSFRLTSPGVIDIGVDDQDWDEIATTGIHASSHKSGGGDPILLHELGAPTSSVDFDGQQAISFVVENRTSDPVSPAVGQIWLRTDL